MFFMPPPGGGGPYPKKRRLFLTAFIFAIAILAAVAVFIGISARSHEPLWTQLLSVLTGRAVTIDVSQPTVVNRIQQLHRLETVVYTMDKLVTGEKSNPILPDFLTGDRLLMMVHGEVIAGIDFSALQAKDVQLNRKEVHVHLPNAQIFTTRLDSAKTRVYSRQTGLLVPTDPNLESQVREEAERQLQESALAGGVLKTANDNARATMTSLLQGLGFEKIEFQ